MDGSEDPFHDIERMIFRVINREELRRPSQKEQALRLEDRAALLNINWA